MNFHTIKSIRYQHMKGGRRCPSNHCLAYCWIVRRPNFLAKSRLTRNTEACTPLPASLVSAGRIRNIRLSLIPAKNNTETRTISIKSGMNPECLNCASYLNTVRVAIILPTYQSFCKYTELAEGTEDGTPFRTETFRSPISTFWAKKKPFTWSSWFCQ